MEGLKLLNEDILVRPIEQQAVNKSMIHVVDTKDHKENTANFFEVLAVAPRVTDVVVGDIVILPLGMHTIPMIWESTRCAITDVSNVMGVVEDAE